MEPDLRNYHGVTPLWKAASGGQEAAVKALIDTGKVDIDVRSTAGRTPIFWAAAYGHHGIVQLLLDAGATQDYEDEEGRSPIAIARSNGQTEIVRSLEENLRKRDIKDKR